jgi:hypothetical protein
MNTGAFTHSALIGLETYSSEDVEQRSWVRPFSTRGPRRDGLTHAQFGVRVPFLNLQGRHSRRYPQCIWTG